MGLFKKKEEVPKIPTSSSLPSLPSLPPIGEQSVKKDLPELPSFPANTKNENINQEMVKSAVSDIPSPGAEELSMEAPEVFPPVEEPKKESVIPQAPMQNLIPEPPMPTIQAPQEMKPKMVQSPSSSMHPSQSLKSDEPIFVRIDKFQSAQKSFEEIKSKMTEVDTVLNKIKDVKLQEEKELKNWTEDIEKLKSRLAEIDNDIFNRL